jgi:hypothetical protein
MPAMMEPHTHLSTLCNVTFYDCQSHSRYTILMRMGKNNDGIPNSYNDDARFHLAASYIWLQFRLALIIGFFLVAVCNFGASVCIHHTRLLARSNPFSCIYCPALTGNFVFGSFSSFGYRWTEYDTIYQTLMGVLDG